MSQENRFIHIEGLGGRVTVCYRFDQPKGETVRSITASFAWCNPNDQFKKLRGRKISAARFERGEVHKIELSNQEGVSITDNVKVFLMDSVDCQSVAISGADDSSFIPRWFQLGFTEQQAESALEDMMANMFKMQMQEAEDASCCGSGSCGHSH
jgi:hypothetical protein